MHTQTNGNSPNDFATIVEFKLNAEIHEEYGDEDFLHQISGRILVGPNQDECRQEAGLMNATLVQFGEAIDQGIDAMRLGDGIDGGVAEYWEALCHGDYGWKEEIQREFHADPSNLLIIDTVEVYPEFRGRQLGIAFVNRLIDIFGSGCGLVACKPFPLQFTPPFKNDPAMLKKLHISAMTQHAAQHKLRMYWSKAGFRHLRNTGIYLISMALRFSPKICAFDGP